MFKPLLCVRRLRRAMAERLYPTEDTVRPVKVPHGATKGLQSRRTLRGHQRWASCLVPNLVPQLLQAWWLPVTEAAVEKTCLLSVVKIVMKVMTVDAAAAVTVHIVAAGTKPCLQRIAEKRRRRRRRRSDPVQHRRLRHLRLPSPAVPQAARKRSRRSRRRRVLPWLWRLEARPPPRSLLGCKAGWMG